jgi:hypothetical protein
MLIFTNMRLHLLSAPSSFHCVCSARNLPCCPFVFQSLYFPPLLCLQGTGYSARLIGLKDMPKGASSLSLDFSSLLGPLFMMWFMQLLFPVNVHLLVHEKEKHLRQMMKMQVGRGLMLYACSRLLLCLCTQICLPRDGHLCNLPFTHLHSAPGFKR